MILEQKIARTTSFRPSPVAVGEGAWVWVTKRERVDGKPWVCEELIYETAAQANEYGARKCAWWGDNLVYLGAEPVEIEGRTFWKPGFNVWN